MKSDPPVRFLDLGLTNQSIRDEIDSAIDRAVESGRYLLGGELEAFESEWAAMTKCSESVGVGCGLDALTLALRALDIGPGDEVLVPSNTYIATWLAISDVGALPIPVEPNPETHLIEAAATFEVLTDRTRAVLPVHLYGQPVDIDRFEAFASKHGIALIFDAAQAHGSIYKGQPIGGRGDVTAWSFYPSKNLGALGDGGAITTNNAEVARRVRCLRNYGSEVRYQFAERGRNSRLDELQAAVLRAKLPYLARWTSARIAIADRYSAAFASTGLGLPIQLSDTETAWHLYVIRSTERDRLREHLEGCGIETLMHYPIAPHQQQAYDDLAPQLGPLPVAEQLAGEVLSLPIGPHLSERDVERVIDAVLGFGNKF
jgi:dTDP-4-amino-4,6-dideoxygalactose transaminase